jgi:PadR family transcriptional regulator, regulatory protein PadR
MTETRKISHTSALILQTIHSGFMYGFDIMDITGLPSGTVYPALRRLEEDELIQGNWEDEKAAGSDRPRRRNYQLSRTGKDALGAALKRYPLLAQLAPEKSGRR